MKETTEIQEEVESFVSRMFTFSFDDFVPVIRAWLNLRLKLLLASIYIIFIIYQSRSSLRFSHALKGCPGMYVGFTSQRFSEPARN